jgi:chitodextrinase
VDTYQQVSADGNLVTVTTPPLDSPPTTPANLTVAPVDSTQITVSWMASSDDVGVTSYQLERCGGVGCSTFAGLATVATPGYTDAGVTPSTSYSYRVRAVDTAGQLSAVSAVASATTPGAPPPPSTPATPVLHWRLDEGSGVTAGDASSSSNAGTLVNNPAWTAGKYGQALSLDGVSAFVRAETTMDLNSVSALTLSAWVKPTALNSFYSNVLVKGVSGQRGYGLNFNYDRLNFVKVGLGDVAGSVSFVPGEWQHAVVTWDQATGQVKFYRNGVLAQTVIHTTPINAPTDEDDLVVGGWLTGGGHFNGAIDEVRIYNRAFTDAEVLGMFNATP